jgi:organic hydroperoxide reductase OsmC/OhrA
MLWYLHLCADAHIVVQGYEDFPTGKMVENSNGSGSFVEVILHPVIKLADHSQVERAIELHEVAHKKCFIANSVNFSVLIEPSVMKV